MAQKDMVAGPDAMVVGAGFPSMVVTMRVTVRMAMSMRMGVRMQGVIVRHCASLARQH